MRFSSIIFFLFLLITLGGFSALGYVLYHSSTREKQPVQQTSYVEVGPLNVLVVQENTDTQSKRVLLCKDTCDTQTTPSGALNGAYTDGQSWYYYATSAPVPSSNKKNKTSNQPLVGLYHVPIKGGDAKPIIIQNALVSPRGISVSPAGKKVIYFLDNITDPQKYLTELWAYDTESNAVHVLLENIHRPDMITRLRWNASGDVLWFVANSGTDKQPKTELIAVSTNSTPPGSIFSQLDWQELTDIADHGVLDVSSDLNNLAYANTNNGNSISIVRKNGIKQAASVAGKVVFLQWLNSGDLLYGLQSPSAVSFWKFHDGTGSKIGQLNGILRSARSDPDGSYIALAADISSNRTQLFSLNVSSGLIKDQTAIPAFGQNVYVVQVNTQNPAGASQVAGISTAFPDDQITALVEKNIATLSNNPTAKATRLSFTASANTVYVEYQGSRQEIGRLLVSVQDVINPEWQVLARYQAIKSEWHKTEGMSVIDPAPTKIYEWEEVLKKWILKTG